MDKPETALALVACNTYAGKEYCLDEWIAAYRALTYKNTSAFMVDNTFTGLQYFHTLQKKGIKVTHLGPWRDKPMEYTLHRGWELILAEAQEQDAFWVYSVEADNIPAPESLEKMIKVASYCNLHLVTHDYPMHASAVEASGMKGNEFFYTELGCMLMSRQLLERALAEYDEWKYTSRAIFRTNEKYRGGHCRMTRSFEVKHLDDYDMEFPQFIDPPSEDNVICPTPYVPATMGTKLPPSLMHEYAVNE